MAFTTILSAAPKDKEADSEPLKVCTKCNISKPLTHFTTKVKSTGRLSARCKQCINAQNVINYQKNIDKRREENNTYYTLNKDKLCEVNRQKYKDKVIKIRTISLTTPLNITNQTWKRINKKKSRELIQKIKEQPCSDCGKIFPYYVMDFDHLDPSTKINSISIMIQQRASSSKLMNEIAKCEVVCAVCHRIRSFNRCSNGYDKEKPPIYFLLKSNPCTDCNNNFPPCALDFDHLMNKQNLVSSLWNRKESVILEEISKCELVCANCHRIRTFNRNLLNGRSSI